jgi:hypothetical protein
LAKTNAGLSTALRSAQDDGFFYGLKGSESGVFGEVLQVDPKLRALFVEMAAFEAECFGGAGDVALVAFEFG